MLKPKKLFPLSLSLSLSLSLIFLLVNPFFALAEESITITTYYPSPYGVYRELRSQRMAIGDDYINHSAVCWEGDTNCDGFGEQTMIPSANDTDLIVQGNVGIGTTGPTQKLAVETVSTGGQSLLTLNVPNAIGNNGAIDFAVNTAGSIVSVARIGSVYTASSKVGLAFSTYGPTLLERVRIDDAGNVGIGTTGPVGKLDVNGTIYQRGAVLHADYVFEPDYKLESIEKHAQYMWKYKHLKAVPKVKVDEKGQQMVEIGANTKGILEELEKAHVYIQQLNERIKVLEARPSTTSPVASDSRVKKDIRPYTNGLSIIKQINPVWFKYNGKAGFPNDDKENHIGVIAQEVVKIAPYTINTFKAKLSPEDKEPADLLNFNPYALTFDLINSVKELDSNIIKLSQENQDLKKDNKELKSELENLKIRLSRLETKVK